jgi:uncharacterized protein YidB (DUF937 family)
MFEDLANKLKAILPDAGDKLVDSAMGAINNPDTGGLHGLVDKLKAGGLGDTVNSWIETGKKNIPITGDQVRKALGNEHLTAMAKKLGLDPSAAADKIAAMLPDAVDAATPDGVLPPKA